MASGPEGADPGWRLAAAEGTEGPAPPSPEGEPGAMPPPGPGLSPDGAGNAPPFPPLPGGDAGGPGPRAPSWRGPAAFAAAAGAALLLAGLGLALDLDRDGSPGHRELRAGTNVLEGDSDADGLADGWEAARGLDPLAHDTDGDLLGDGAEVEARSDPASFDSDADGLGDALEWEGTDCDGDGVAGILESDDDADGRADALEPQRDRCTADSDGDGLLDGSEGNAACTRLEDCDADGVPDADEAASDGYDPLDPDSFGSGVPDSISRAFQESGQPAGSDGDEDGIPDGWEASAGLIEWGEFAPEPGRRDFLVEFVRVEGPDSRRYHSLGFEDTYEAVADTVLEEQGIAMGWVETVVRLDEEQDPPIIPTSDDPYYAEVLEAATYSENPYVTTVVLNPQHDQSQILHAGVAPIRGMLAAVDYGAHVTVKFTYPGAPDPVTIHPLVESVVRGGRQDLVRGMGFDFGDITPDGELVLRSEAEDYTLRWQTSWFATDPVVEFDSGSTLQLTPVDADVDEADLARTLLHEVGHTLGLCHTHVAECSQGYSYADRVNQARSTMSYDAAPGTLHFLRSEWEVASTYLTCPPQGPLTELAGGGSGAAIREAKYAYSAQSLEDLQLRECASLDPIARDYGPDDPAPTQFVAPQSFASAHAGSGPWLGVGYIVLALAASAGVGTTVWRRLA